MGGITVFVGLNDQNDTIVWADRELLDWMKHCGLSACACTNTWHPADEVLSCKLQKERNNRNKMNSQDSGSSTPHQGVPTKTNKSEMGEWRRKKGPAPLRPVPQKRNIKKLPMRAIQTELHDIEVQQTGLERQGVLLEQAIRERTEDKNNEPDNSSGPNSIEVEDMILQLFELVNEKNELFRRQTELMYLKREKRLEEEYAELEYQIRCLMLKAPKERSEEDTAHEEELIARLVKVVEQRDEIINCLELDRLREAQEDESIATQMMKYQEKHIDGIESPANGTLEKPKKKKALKLPKKKKKEKVKKDKKGEKVDADKDVDEVEAKEKKKKKKWFLSPKPN